ncbi:hypothetical protein EYR41_006155 [Orbilia oligospora]|uniref:VWFA domain-containing protein n=1 Tax=Orbilia oligospora TaxID=2813651 RepID=A0A8H2E2E6_ORBOL|nr:hypothetical protein EYR41_006155 [Orbilia oligospora]
MTGVFDMDRSRNRRDRTFVGSPCAVCDELLEHTLRGERVLQFSCQHVAHEACFYEYIREIDSQHCPTCDAPLGLDTSRGGNVLDIEKLSNVVKAASVMEAEASRKYSQSQQSVRHESSVPSGHWDVHSPNRWDSGSFSQPSGSFSQPSGSFSQPSGSFSQPGHFSQPPGSFSQPPGSFSQPTPSNARSEHASSYHQGSRESRESREGRESRDSRDSRPELRETPRVDTGHWRTPSNASAADFPETPSMRRQHDFDVQNMESVVSPRDQPQNPIDPPTVTVRSEFPTLTRSKVQQALTCLVTIEVPERKWVPTGDESPAPPVPPVRGGVDDPYRPPSPSTSNRSASGTYGNNAKSAANMEQITEDLRQRVENWHSLDVSRFGKLRLFGTIKVGKDCQSWQELECFLFSEMLICVKEKKIPNTASGQWGPNGRKKSGKCTLKGSILIKKHLKQVSDSSSTDNHILTLNLSVAELPSFHLQFPNHSQLEQWRRALLNLNSEMLDAPHDDDRIQSDPDEELDGRYSTRRKGHRASSANSSIGGARSVVSAPTEYTTSSRILRTTLAAHVPIDLVVVIPVTSSMQGLKINLLRESLRFLVGTLGEKDRMGLVSFGSSGGGVALVGMTSKNWSSWNRVINSIRPVGQKSLRADVVEGANAAMDLLMQRKVSNPISSILLISDSSTSDVEAVDFVISRAEAAKVSIHSFGLGLTHKPDTMIELSTRTKASYTYVKDWMMLRECLAGCMGALQSSSHQNVKVKLKLPEGSPARFTKISGALQVTKRATGREAEAALGDLRFGDKKDVLVQLVIDPDQNTNELPPADPWETIVSGLEALGGPLDAEEQRVQSIEEVPLIQADLIYGDIQRDGALSQSSRPSLLTISMLPSTSNKSRQSHARPGSPPIPPHPMIVQRRMELLTSDMLSRALTLVSKGQHDRAQTLLSETRTILRGLGKGGLPPLPPPPGSDHGDVTPIATQSSNWDGKYSPTAGIDSRVVGCLDSELEAALEWIAHPAVFARDSRKAVLQAIGVISGQRAITFRTPSESYHASRVFGVKHLTAQAREWHGNSEDLAEED